MRTAGLTGCKTGWLLMSLSDDNRHYRILEGNTRLEEVFSGYDRIFIDITIGLLEEESARHCDLLLRQRLGEEYASQVIDPPVRSALSAPTYVEASMENYELTGEKLSLQAWNRTPRIRTVNDLLQREISFQTTVLESHPELNLMSLNGRMIYQKKSTKKGLRHRLDLIAAHHPVVVDYFREIKEKYRRNEVEEVEIVDAAALAYGAEASAGQPMKTLPETPEEDAVGLKMAIHYV